MHGTELFEPLETKGFRHWQTFRDSAPFGGIKWLI